MRLKQLENQWRVYLNPQDYSRLRACAESRAAHIAIRLGGECGLRVNETAKLKIEDTRGTTAKVPGDAYFLQVYGKDTTGTYDQGKFRETFMPASLNAEIQMHAEDNDIAEDEELIPVTKRTVQEYIKRAAKATAKRYDIEDFNKVSSHDLRAYWATNLLVRLQVDENVVMACGGWTGRDTMEPYINAAFDDIIVREMRDAGIN